MKSYSQRKNERLLREFVGPRGQIDPMAMTNQPNPMQMSPMGQPQMGQTPPMGQPQMGGMNPMMGMNPAVGGQTPPMGDMSQSMGGPNPMMGDMNPGPDDMGGDMSGQQPAPEGQPSPEDDMPSQLNAAVRFLKGKSAQQIMDFQQKFNTAVQGLLTGKSKSAGKKGLWQQFQQTKDAKANWGKPEDATAP